MTNPDTLRYVEGELNYLVQMAERPRYYAYDAGPDAPPTNMAHEVHRVRHRRSSAAAPASERDN